MYKYLKTLQAQRNLFDSILSCSVDVQKNFEHQVTAEKAKTNREDPDQTASEEAV